MKSIVKQNFRDPGFLLFRARDSNSKAKTERDSVLEVCAVGEMANTTLGITELNSILGQDYGIKELYSGSSMEVFAIITFETL